MKSDLHASGCVPTTTIIMLLYVFMHKIEQKFWQGRGKGTEKMALCTLQRAGIALQVTKSAC